MAMIDNIAPKEKDYVAPQGIADRQMATNLYRQYRSLVYWTAYPLLNNAQDAEDLTQDIFLRLLHHNKFDPERGSIVHFLRTITRCRAIDRLRKKEAKQRAQVRLSAICPEAPVSPLENAITQERAEQVYSALPHLSVKQRQVLELAHFGGLSHPQIARRLNIPLGTVKSRVHKAQGALRFRLVACWPTLT